MPWKASSVMDERLRFVARLLDGEAMSDVCREFGISRKTGYKIFDRYGEHGLEALSDRSRRPVRYANQLPAQVETLIVQLKAGKPHWSARKIRELLVQRLDGEVEAADTFGDSTTRICPSPSMITSTAPASLAARITRAILGSTTRHGVNLWDGNDRLMPQLSNR